jgi:amidase
MDATAQAELVRRRELTPLELVDAAIARIERVNPIINAVITPLFEEARKVAASPDLPDGSFRGVPFLLKDIGAMQRGQPYYMGNKALRDAGYRSPADTTLGARSRAAGFITLGRPMCLSSECSPRPSRWLLARLATPGTWIDRAADRQAVPARPWQPAWFR